MGWYIQQKKKQTKFSMSKENYKKAFPILKELLLKEFSDNKLYRNEEELIHIERSKDLADMFRNFGWDMKISKVKPNLSNIEDKVNFIIENLEWLRDKNDVLDVKSFRNSLNPSINSAKVLLDEFKGETEKYVHNIVNTTDDYGYFNMIFEHLAPFVNEGSYITIQSMEDTCELTRESFENGKLKSKVQKEVWV